MQTIKFKITDITCASCVKLSTAALEDLQGVKVISMDKTTGAVEINSERDIQWDEIKDALQAVGKKAVMNN